MRFPALMLVPVLVLGLAAARAAGLPDTGQDQCDPGSYVLTTCTSANVGDAATYPRQDGRFGRDAKAAAGTLTKSGGGAAGFDYSKVTNDGTIVPGDGAGIALGTNPGDWACTRDNITELTWEVKVNNASHLRHMDWFYTWYDSNSSTNGGNAGTPDTGAGVGGDTCLDPSRCDTEKFVADVNAAALCGYSDWRMPTQRELLTLVHAGASSPSIDVTYFPNTIGSVGSGFWSGTSYVPDSARVRSVSFFEGFTGAGNKTFAGAVRLVRGGPF